MRVLVTGISGFTGHYVQKELESYGHTVIGLQADLTIPLDVAREVEVIQPEAVIHLAAISFVCQGDANVFYRTNLIGTRNLLEAISKYSSNVSYVLLASSANVYGNSTGGKLDESMPPNPANDYAVSKLAMEFMAKLWADKLPITIVRPFNYTGVGQSVNFLIPKIVDHFRRRAQEIELGNIHVARDFSDVRTIAATYRRLLEIGPSGEIFNVCSGAAFTISHILSLMIEIAGYEITVKVNPLFVRDNEVECLVGSGEKLARYIGEDVHIPLRSTLEWMYTATS